MDAGMSLGMKRIRSECDMNEWLPEGKLSLVSTNFFQRKAPLLWAWREAPALVNDSGWRFLSQADTTTSLKHSQAKLVSYEQVLALEPAIAFIYRYPLGADMQFSNKTNPPHFVYNDSYEKVRPIPANEDYPIKDPVFKRHFPSFVQSYQGDKTGLSWSYQLSQEELAQLNHLNGELVTFFNLCLEQTDRLDNDLDYYLLAGLALGFLHISDEASPADHWQDNVNNVIANALFTRFSYPLEKGKQVVLQFLSDRKSSPVAQQIHLYGEQMRLWYQANQKQRIQGEYQGLRNHYIKD
ncbi:hypothetical protein B6C83_07050 [Aerococcus urinae]|nr:hypothetical protein B6C83_07050 [Aerococcus urinae]RAV65732.1 DUF2185 domain-containing protein [Aerococcus urinae]